MQSYVERIMQSGRSQTCQVVNKFEGIYAQRFAALCIELSTTTGHFPVTTEQAYTLFDAELIWIDQQNGNALDNLRYRTFVLILRDLITVGWRVFYSSYGVEIAAPPSYRRSGLSREEQSQSKNSVRNALAAARDEQLDDPSTRRFVRAMEEPSPAHKHQHSIRKLLANGADLAARLGDIDNRPVDEQIAKLRETVRPYLVLVNGEERDPHTGIKYGDIWRYFRLTWAIPNIPAPGRKIFYLVRDAAQPYNPVMAIAALSNTALQVKDRDDYIGWTAESVMHRLRSALATNNSGQVESIITLMERHVEQGLADIDSSGMVAPSEMTEPTETVLRGLQSLTEGYVRERQLQLSFLNGTPETINEDVDDTLILEYEDPESIGAEHHAEVGTPQVSDAILGIDKKANRNTLKVRRQMILKKRSLALYQLLYARRVLRQLRAAANLSAAVTTALPRDEFRAALTYALFSNKRERAT